MTVHAQTRPRWSVRYKLLRLAVIAALTYCAMVLFTAGYQRSLIYYPNQSNEAALLELAAARGMQPWKDPGGAVIGWRSREIAGAGEGGPAILVFHGNAGFALHRSGYARGFLRLSPPLPVFILEYPGYGARPGNPSQDAFFTAADQALATLLEQGYGSLIVVGESLGSGVACYLAAQTPEDIMGLLLITPFSSLVDVGRSHYPLLPVNLLLRDRFDNLTALESYQGPIAFLIAESDEIIPESVSDRLYQSYRGPKQRWLQRGQGHNSIDYSPAADWWEEVVSFIHQHPAVTDFSPGGRSDR